jgi:hypothetical protein
MDATAALRRMRELVRPGGTVAVLGLPRSRYPLDLPRDAVATIAIQTQRIVKHHWESRAPTSSPPRHTFRQICALAEPLLPGAFMRRHLLWRYSLIWTKAIGPKAASAHDRLRPWTPQPRAQASGRLGTLI